MIHTNRIIEFRSFKFNNVNNIQFKEGKKRNKETEHAYYSELDLFCFYLIHWYHTNSFVFVCNFI